MSAENPPCGPFVVTATGSGELTRAQCRNPRFSQPSRSLRAPVGADSLVERGRAVVLVSRDDAVLWGPSAADLLGLPLPHRLQSAKVHVVVPADRPRPRRVGVQARQADFVGQEATVVDGVRITTPARTFVDLAAMLALPELVTVGDAAIRRYFVSAHDLRIVLNRRLRYRGKVLARRAIPLLDGRAESPPESRLRVLIVEDGLPAPAVNAVITDEDGQFIARCDLAYLEWGIVIEYGGEVHASRRMRHADAARGTLLREHGWQIVEIVADDLRYPERAIGEVRRAPVMAGAI